ncbi:hypothetical protein NW819_10580, partial [Synechococcus sp. R8-2]|uniref:hypothetical protein n=1 Tax=Synechococcus sp. R8-2 TaxID=2291959 RepID=UPI0039C4B1B7
APHRYRDPGVEFAVGWLDHDLTSIHHSCPATEGSRCRSRLVDGAVPDGAPTQTASKIPFPPVARGILAQRHTL